MYLFLYFFLVIQSLIRCFIKCCSLRECSPTLWLAMSDVCKSNNKSPTPTRAYVHVHAQQFFPKCSPALNKAGVVKKLLQNKKYSGAVLSVLVLFDFFFLIRGSFFYDEEMLFCFLFFFFDDTFTAMVCVGLPGCCCCFCLFGFDVVLLYMIESSHMPKWCLLRLLLWKKKKKEMQ